MYFASLSYVIWDVNPSVFPGLEIPRWYGVFWALGIILSYPVMFYVFKKEGRSVESLETLGFYILLGTILGARLGHILFYDPVYYWQHPIEILPVRFNPDFEFTGLAGLASHGGGVGIFLSIYLYCRKYNENYLWLLDRLVMPAALTGAFIRFGNLLNSEMIGVPADVPWAFVFVRTDQIPRHPAQLYESIYCLVLFVMMFLIWKVKRTHLQNGFILGIFLILLFSLRFVDEFFKINQVPFENSLPINMGQLLSIPFVLAGVAILIWRYYKMAKSL